jgi:hypothetical protein
MGKHVMLIAFNDQIFYNQANLLILSLLTVSEPDEIIIHLYTDENSWIPLSIINKIKVYKLTSDKINELKGEQNFIHRVKIALIEDLCNKVTGNIIYVDTDCIVTSKFTELYKEIENGMFLMHQEEFSFEKSGNINNESIEQLRKKLTDKYNISNSVNAKHELFKLNYSMWNAGVIGVSTDKIKPLFPVIYDLTSYIFSISKLHTSEQLAFSIILQREGKLIEAKDFVYHYWDADEKESVNEYLSKNLARLNNLFSLKGDLSKELEFDNFQRRIRNSYVVLRNLSVSALQNNSFSVGYKQLCLAFIKNPLLDKTFSSEVKFHLKRHFKHLVKSALGRYK